MKHPIRPPGGGNIAETMAVRLLALVLTLVALVAIALAGNQLRRVVATAGPGGDEAAPAARRDDPQPPAPAAGPAGRWPALFGDLRVAEPQPPAPAVPPAPPMPPVASLGYALRGTVTLGGKTWAILSHPTGERILSVGDDLVAGMTVVAIDATGLWVDTGRGRDVLEFAQ